MGFIKDFRTYAAGIKALGELSKKSSVAFITHDDISYPKPHAALQDLSFLWGQHSDSNLINLYHTIEEIYTPVNLIAKAVADGIPVVKRIEDDSVVYDNKYLNPLFNKPNALQNWRQLIEQAIAFELVTGKNMLYANSNDYASLSYRTIYTLQNLLVDQVTIDTGTSVKLLSATELSDIIKHFIITDGAGAQVKIPPEKVLYSKCTSLKAVDLNVMGRSPLEAANKAVEVLAAIYVALGAIYTKGGPRGMIVPRTNGSSSDIALNPPDKMKVIKDLNERYGFTKGKFPFGITDQQVGWEKMGADIQELQPAEMYQLCCAAIFNLYGIPRELMPNAQGATYENQNQARKSVYEQIAIPRAKSLYDSISAWLKLEDVGLYLDVDYSHISLLQANLKEKSEVDWKNNETYRIRFTNGIATLNDWRIATGAEPVTGNGMYDKLVYDMDDTELAKVEAIMRMSKGGAVAASNNPSNDNSNGNQ